MTGARRGRGGKNLIAAGGQVGYSLESFFGQLACAREFCDAALSWRMSVTLLLYPAGRFVHVETA